MNDLGIGSIALQEFEGPRSYDPSLITTAESGDHATKDAKRKSY